ncbi:cytidine deaminase [Penicillium manginii]|uniref:cytidine deaminase n=1 Tax=Penicillium manginii TaxID=203109 RepID=UPI002548D516|nr:cytidine deaminase [Penicillium manginii]KAJ5742086.1 cytidine deaminase [Penicillium manginii]
MPPLPNAKLPTVLSSPTHPSSAYPRARGRSSSLPPYGEPNRPDQLTHSYLTGPYSKFRVGACIITDAGEYIVGANVENAAYPVGTCAERVAFATAIVAGHKDFKAIAVATDIKPVCASSRPPSFPIYMYDGEGNYTVKTMGELLPDSFGPSHLPK